MEVPSSEPAPSREELARSIPSFLEPHSNLSWLSSPEGFSRVLPHQHTNRKDSKETAILIFLKLYAKLYHCLNGPIFYSLKDSILSLTCLQNASSLTMKLGREREEKGALNLP